MNIAIVKYTTSYKENVAEMLDIDKELNGYAFRNEIPGLEVGDFVVVNSKNNLGIARVTKVLENTFENSGTANKAKSYIVAKFDVSSLKAREEAEARREWLKIELARKKDQMEDLMIYKALAETDKEAAEMLEELKLLG